jgi:hypothetical protein
MREDPIIPAGTKWDFKPLPIHNRPPPLKRNAGGMKIKKSRRHR